MGGLKYGTKEMFESGSCRNLQIFTRRDVVHFLCLIDDVIFRIFTQNAWKT